MHLIGPRNAEPRVTAACVIADWVADLAVLGPPDDQEFDCLRQLVTGLIQRLAKHKPDVLGLLDDTYLFKFAPPDPGAKNSGDVNQRLNRVQSLRRR